MSSIDTIKDIVHGKLDLIVDGKIDIILGSIACVTLVALYLSPVPTFWRMIKKQSTEQFHPYLYVTLFINCWFWLFYTMLPDEKPPTISFRFLCIFVSSDIARSLFMIYIGIFFCLTTKSYNTIMACFPFVMISVFIAVGFTAYLWSRTGLDGDSLEMMLHYRLIGPLCVVSGILTYASPLTIVKKVYQTKSVEYLPFWFCLASFFNGLAWFIYACATPTSDPYIAITHGVGMLLGLSGLRVYNNFRMNIPKSNVGHPESAKEFKDYHGKIISIYGISLVVTILLMLIISWCIGYSGYIHPVAMPPV